jgi:hypothetical protein
LFLGSVHFQSFRFSVKSILSLVHGTDRFTDETNKCKVSEKTEEC